MSAEYVSPKPDGYMSERNEIYRHREIVQQAETLARAQAAKVPAPMSNANYGMGKIKY